MHAVVNHLPIKPDADWNALAGKFETFNTIIDSPDFCGCSLIHAGAEEAIILVLFRTRSALDDFSSNIAAPWFAEHVRPFLAGPVSRSTGEIVAGPLTSNA